jgi:charged multivesicular body protein 4
MPYASKMGINTRLIFQDELERELEELEQEELDKELLGVGPLVDELPSVPTTDIAKPTPTKTKASRY